MKLDSFNFSTVQSFLQLLNMLEADGTTDLRFTRQKVHDYVQQGALDINRFHRKKKRNMVAPVKCKECGSIARELSVNTSNENVVEGGYTKVILCTTCLYEEWI